MINLFDAHCHLSDMPESGIVTGFICNSVNESDWYHILNIANQNKNIFPALGVHPWCVSTVSSDWDLRLYQILSENSVAMIGECGLDKLRPDYDMQLAVFVRHLEIADRLRRPIHIHCVRAWHDCYAQMRKFKNIPAFIVHGYGGDALFNLPNVYYSVGRAVLDSRRTRLHNALINIPHNRILIESDAKMTESESILRPVCAYICENLGITAEQLYRNSQQILTF